MRTVHAELRKLIGLPATWLSVGAAVVLPAAFTLLTSRQITDGRKLGVENASASTIDLAFAEFQFTMLAAVVLGVVASASEYTPSSNTPGAGRQVTTSMLSCPGRIRLLMAKATALLAVAVTTSAASIGLAMAVATGNEPEWGDPVGRFAGAVIYWCAVAFMSCAIGLAVRNTAVPIVVLGVNLSAVSFSFLLLQVTPLARYLPDLAGAGLLLRDVTFEPLPAVTGGLVMWVWVVGLWLLAGALFVRRDV